MGTKSNWNVRPKTLCIYVNPSISNSKKLRFILAKCYFWAGFFQNVTFGLKKLKQMGTKSNWNVRPETLCIYVNPSISNCK